jgi:hypothetical protein
MSSKTLETQAHAARRRWLEEHSDNEEEDKQHDEGVT